MMYPRQLGNFRFKVLYMYIDAVLSFKIMQNKKQGWFMHHSYSILSVPAELGSLWQTPLFFSSGGIHVPLLLISKAFVNCNGMY